MRLTDVTIVVRSAYERTETLASELAAGEADHVEVIHERPFRAALMRGFEIGLAHGRPWTLCLDADILLIPGALRRLRAVAEASPDALGCGGWTFDKFYGDLKVRGVHLYRTSLLSRALELVRSDPPEAPRPETRVHEQMATLGHPWDLLRGAIGLHGHAQYFRDIYRTNAVRTLKSSSDHSLLVRRARLGARYDADFRVMLWALESGTAVHADADLLDRDRWTQDFERLIARHGLEERMPPTRAERLALRAALAALASVPPAAVWWIATRLTRLRRRFIER